jgi:hypothetical protein
LEVNGPAVAIADHFALTRVGGERTASGEQQFFLQVAAGIRTQGVGDTVTIGSLHLDGSNVFSSLPVSRPPFAVATGDFEKWSMVRNDMQNYFGSYPNAAVSDSYVIMQK